MAIIKESNGSYTLHYTKTDNVTGNKIRTKKRGFKTLKEAKEYERSLSRESSTVSFYSLYKECQNTIDQEEDTRLNKDSIIRRYLPAFMTIKYEDLTKQYLSNIRSELSKLDLSPKTKNKIIDIITSTCKYANEIYDLPDNSKILKRFKMSKKEFDIWTPEEYFRFEEGLKPTFEDCVPFFRCLFFTGMRKGEARALSVDDLDVEKGIITINKSMRKYKSSLKAPKTPAGNRKIKIDANTLEMLKPLKQHEKWLFGDYKPISRDRVDRAFKYGIEKSGVKKIRIHDLRHSHASFLITKHANIIAVSRRLGHSSINMTLNTYAHLMADAENEMVEILNVASLLPPNSEKADK